MKENLLDVIHLFSKIHLQMTNPFECLVLKLVLRKVNLNDRKFYQHLCKKRGLNLEISLLSNFYRNSNTLKVNL